MMKLVLLCALLHLAVSQEHCTSDTDCATDECCARPLLGRRRRFVFGDGIFGGGSSGTCKPLAQEGHSCEPDLLTFGGSQAHSFGCPCAEHLECHGEQESHHGGSHSYTNPTCIPEGTYTGGTGTQQGSSGTGTQQGSGGTGSGSVTHRPPATHAPVIDPNQPIEELPGK